MYGAFELNQPLKRSSNVDPNDVFSVKTVLNDLGLYKTPDWGITEYPDESLFKGIETFQHDYGLKVDGVMKPGGETERSISALMAPNLGKRSRRPVRKKDGVQRAAAPAASAIPWIASQFPSWAAGIGAMLGLTLPLEGDTPKDDNCDHQLYNVDIPTCNAISKRRGKQAAARCHASASQRHAACRQGKPPDQWPPLDTWNN